MKIKKLIRQSQIKEFLKKEKKKKANKVCLGKTKERMEIFNRLRSLGKTKERTKIFNLLRIGKKTSKRVAKRFA